MKIAVYYDLCPGGAARAMEEMLPLLEQRNELVYFQSPDIFPKSPIFSRLFVDLESLVFQRFKQKRLAKQIDRQHFDSVFISHDQHPHSPWMLRFLKTPTVFLCQEPTRAFYEKFLEIDPQMPVLNKLYENLNRYFRKKIEENNIKFATKVVTSSLYSIESVFRAYGVSSTELYPGIDSLKYHPTNTTKKNQVLVVGNNEPQKNLVYSVEVLALVNNKIRPKLVIASPRNKDISEIIKLAKRKKVELIVATELDQDGMRELYNFAKITVGFAHLEPFGMSIIESLACGTPVIAINEAGYRETIKNGQTGFLVERNKIKIAKAIEFMLQDKAKRDRMGRKGIIDVNKRFTWENTVQKLEKIIYETTKDKSKHHHR